MRKLITLLVFLLTAGAFAQGPIRIGNTDRQKVTQFDVSNDSLRFHIENDVQRRIDVSGVLGSNYHYNTISSSITAENTNVTETGQSSADKAWNRVTTNDTITLDNTITLTGHPFIIQPWGADSVYVKKGSGVTFYVADLSAATGADGVVVKQRHPLTVLKTASSEFFLQGALITHTESVAGPVYQGLNAADPVNEVNGTANTVNNHLSTATWSSVTTTPTPPTGGGTYALKITHGGGTDVQAAGFVTAKGVLSGQNVTITMDVYDSNINTRWQVRLHADDGWTVTSPVENPAQQVWESIELTGTADEDDPQIEFFTTTNADTGDYMGVDKIVITVN